MKAPDRCVYLAGPIVGVEYGEARNGWRSEFEALLHRKPWQTEPDEVTGWGISGHIATSPHIHCLSPLRGRSILQSNEVVAPGLEFTIDDPLENAKSMLARDTNDIRMADLVVANLSGAKRAALGTTAELGFAYALNKPVVLIMEKDPSVFHYHGFIVGIASFWVETVPEAVEVVRTLMTPGV